jgi:uncharacterized protein (TIGR02246 family)
MSDYAEIVSAIARVMWAVDHRDRQLFSDGWAEDVDFEVTFFGQQPVRLRGREELVNRFTTGWNGEPTELRHQIGAIDIEVTGEGLARAYFYCTYVRTGEAPGLAGMGEYEDDLVRSADGRWRIARRRHRFLTPLAH